MNKCEWIFLRIMDCICNVGTRSFRRIYISSMCMNHSRWSSTMERLDSLLVIDSVVGVNSAWCTCRKHFDYFRLLQNSWNTSLLYHTKFLSFLKQLSMDFFIVDQKYGKGWVLRLISLFWHSIVHFARYLYLPTSLPACGGELCAFSCELLRLITELRLTT